MLAPEDIQSIQGVVKTGVDNALVAFRGEVRKDIKTEIAVALIPFREEIRKDIKTEIAGALVPVWEEIKDLRHDMNGLREQIQHLAVTLDKFLKRITDYEDELTLLKADVHRIKDILKEKLGVEVAI